jgi:uncharacterized membrane protein
MTPLIVLLTVFSTLLLAKALGLPALRRASWVHFVRWSMAAMFLLTASAHFGSRRADLVRMVPDIFPNPELLVTLTGVAELAGAVGLAIPRYAPYAARALLLLLIAMFPANVHAAREQLSIGGQPVTPLLPRTLLQLFFIAWALMASRPLGRVKADFPCNGGRRQERSEHVNCESIRSQR